MDSQRSTRVFINCPFDDLYLPIFHAIIFAIHDCGFEARHALINTGNPVRLIRITEEIAGSAYSVHDLSRVEVGGKYKLPRFNMPFEAGIAYAQSFFAAADSSHQILLLDSKPYRYQAALSDVSGLDPKIHDGKPEKAVAAVRAFLREKAPAGANIPDEDVIWQRYLLFQAFLPEAAKKIRVSAEKLSEISYIVDLHYLMALWVMDNRPPAP